MRTQRVLGLVGACLAGMLVAGDVQAAANVEITLTPEAQARFDQFGVPTGQLATAVSGEVTKLFALADTQGYLRRFGDAQSFATKGLGADYASNLRYVLVGVGGNVSLNVKDGYVPKDARGEPPVEATGTNFTFLAGVNLGIIGLPQVSIFGNYFQGSTFFNGLDGDLSNVGVHGQVTMFGPKGSGVGLPIQWGGISVTSGFDRSRLQLSLRPQERLRTSFRVSDQAGAPNIDLDAGGSFRADLRSLSVPLEVTTSLRLLYIVSVYGGLGFDWQFGGTYDLDMTLDGRMKAKLPSRANPSITETVDVGTVRVTASDSASPSAGQVRSLLGVQVNVLFVRLFTQLNMLPAQGLYGVAFGARLGW